MSHSYQQARLTSGIWKITRNIAVCVWPQCLYSENSLAFPCHSFEHRLSLPVIWRFHAHRYTTCKRKCRQCRSSQPTWHAALLNQKHDAPCSWESPEVKTPNSEAAWVASRWPAEKFAVSTPSLLCLVCGDEKAHCPIWGSVLTSHSQQASTK